MRSSPYYKYRQVDMSAIAEEDKVKLSSDVIHPMALFTRQVIAPWGELGASEHDDVSTFNVNYINRSLAS